MCQIICGLLGALALVDALVYFTDDQHGSAFLVGPLLLAVSYVTAGLVIRYEFRRSVNSSGFVFCFWLLCAATTCLLLVSTVRTRYAQFHRLDGVRTATLFATTALVIAQLGLHCLPDNACLTSRELFGESSAGYRRPQERTETREEADAEEDDETAPVLYSLGDGSETGSTAPARGEQSALLASSSGAGLHRASVAGVPRVSARKPCGELLASFLSRVTFAWFTQYTLFVLLLFLCIHAVPFGVI